MIIGIPKEIKQHEYRVGLTPLGTQTLTRSGHQVLIEHNAGIATGFIDQDYQKAGADIIDSAQEVFHQAELLVKVKEPQPTECRMLNEKHLLFTYLHLAADPVQARLLLESEATCIAYETVTNTQGQLPLLKPMSEIAGKISIQSGAHALEKTQGGSGVLLGGATGADAAEVLILGGGIVGTNAATIALGMGAHVSILDKHLSSQLTHFQHTHPDQLHIDLCSQENLEKQLKKADLIVGAALVTGAQAPKLLTHEMLPRIKRGSVLVDVAIDQGGCFETSHATTYDKPTFEIDGIIHHCVANMPSAVPRTATLALTHATLPHILSIATHGFHQALHNDPHLMHGLNIQHGHITHQAVAQSLGYPYTHPAIKKNGLHH
jgi:alanine dehydrogenase